MTGVVVCSIECGWSKVRAPHEGGKDFVFGCRAHLETCHTSESLSRFYEYRGYWDAVRLGDVDPNLSAWKNEYRVLSEVQRGVSIQWLVTSSTMNTSSLILIC